MKSNPTVGEVETRLEGHEEVCSERYRHIETKFEDVEGRLEEVKEDVKEVKGLIDRTFWALIVGMGSLLAAILFNGHM